MATGFLLITITHLPIYPFTHLPIYPFTHSFMRNKPNLLDAQMNVKSFHAVDYENIANWTLGENKPNQTQFQTGRLLIDPMLPLYPVRKPALWAGMIFSTNLITQRGFNTPPEFSNGVYKPGNDRYYIRHIRRCSSMAEHSFRKAEVVGPTPTIGCGPLILRAIYMNSEDTSANINDANTHRTKKFIRFAKYVIIIFVLLIIVLYFYQFIDPRIEKRNLSYADWRKSIGYNGWVRLPENSGKIRFCLYPWFDVNYIYIEAEVNAQDISIYDLAKKSIPSNISSVYLGKDIDFSEVEFKEYFSIKHSKPRWWSQKTMSHFNANSIVVWQDPNSTLYGRGVWYFYNDNDRKLRVFTWSQQHLKAEEVAQTFLLEKVEVE